jgi:hypothetical protein
VFTTTLVLPTGRYEYKYVQNGKNYWHDPANWREAGFFNNSVLTGGKGRSPSEVNDRLPARARLG